MSAELSDPGSARVKRLRRLTGRSSRAEARQFLAEGAQACREALAAHAQGRAVVRELILGADERDKHAELGALAEQSAVSVTWASDEVLAALSETVTPQGIVAVVDFVDVALADVVADGPAMVAVLADVRDPGNAGSVVRAADAAGADAVVFAGDSVDPFNGKAVRASVGGLFHLPIVVGVGVAETLQGLRAAGLRVLVADGTGDVDLDATGLAREMSLPTAWVFGNEAWGVPESVKTMADVVVRIPIYGKAESLNLATAATLCLYASARAQNDRTA